jgi:extracellular matrix regulatory protein B
MFLHIGGDIEVPKKNIIGIFDMETATISKVTKNYLKTEEENGNIKGISNELPRTFILVERDGKKQVFLSPISSSTLYKRTKKI